MDLLRDIRFAGRLLVKNRWFTVMAVVVLALGIGANNAVFTIVNGVLLRNLPVAQPEEIMFLGTRDTQGRNQGVSLRDFEDWRAATRTFAGMSFLFNGAFNVGNEGLTPDQIPGGYVSPNLFKMLGVSPALGRDFTPAEETPGTPIVVLISNTLWRQRYGSRSEYRRQADPHHRSRRHDHRGDAGGHALPLQREYLAANRRDASCHHRAAASGAGLLRRGTPQRRRDRGTGARRAQDHRQQRWLRSIRRPTRTSGRTRIPSSNAFSARRSRCSSGR